MKKWYAVIGNPIGHSMSPFMHNSWFSQMEIDATYIPIQVIEEDLDRAVSSMNLLGISGFNVTIPHKEKIIPLLDILDPMAEKMGAVNTVVRLEDGRLKGFNTDGLGFVRSLEEVVGDQLKSEEVLIIGAGGAARGIAFALETLGYSHLTICNRTVEKAVAICSELEQKAAAISLQQASEQLNQFKIIIQTTPAGLKNGDFSLPFSIEKLNSTAIVADIVYNPLMTPFLEAASQKGATTVSGLGMFVHQGALAFNYWTGQSPDLLAVKKQLIENLGGN
ncbi:shikimate dehydrogenase [Kurthia zopfii]|uniref:shikimate dehydrogenase n=1 Tax=Kurthia zopfii TaxID=1650 RepID=UPI000F707226|nr:shikimate dehydrogenase [Kurthia zopfii]VEI07805.1 Shikimate dehydrogenase [Kurthia zopfii]